MEIYLFKDCFVKIFVLCQLFFSYIVIFSKKEMFLERYVVKIMDWLVTQENCLCNLVVSIQFSNNISLQIILRILDQVHDCRWLDFSLFQFSKQYLAAKKSFKTQLMSAIADTVEQRAFQHLNFYDFYYNTNFCDFVFLQCFK
eukprot:TRINITY_DN13883_c0_g2_i1.p4 TRINITY_DN13883_c0_g2~~TRINITY_DN13883_c0_g2_i1.p4  ORF type:complete len:143 (+),score=0.82 TRINITY_DN13883_c0_g2_i1:582-1010(+)